MADPNPPAESFDELVVRVAQRLGDPAGTKLDRIEGWSAKDRATRRRLRRSAVALLHEIERYQGRSFRRRPNGAAEQERT